MQEGEDGQKELGSHTMKEWTGIGITTCVREAKDRHKWRKIVKLSKCPQRPTKAAGMTMTFSSSSFLYLLPITCKLLSFNCVCNCECNLLIFFVVLLTKLTSILPDFFPRSIISTVDSAIRQSDLELLRLSVLTDATTQKIAIKKWVALESGQQVDYTHHSWFTFKCDYG